MSARRMFDLKDVDSRQRQEIEPMMNKVPFASPANTVDLKTAGYLAAAMAATFAVVLSLPHQPVRGVWLGDARLVAALALFLAQVCVVVVGSRAVRRTVTAVGDGARARIQAQTFRAASYIALSLGLIVAPFGYDLPAAIVTDVAGVLMLVFVALIVGSALTPGAVRSRLEREADRQPGL